MTKSHLIAAMALAAGLMISLKAEASDPKIEIVSAQESAHLIPKETFDEVAWQLYGPPTVTEPSRGTLTVVNDGILYTPGSEFGALGFDSFRFSFEASSPEQSPGNPPPDEPVAGSSTLEEVYLVEDLKRQLPDFALTSCTLSPGWSYGGDASKLQIVPGGFNNSGCYFEITLGGPVGTFIHKGRPPGPGGGNTAFLLDTGPGSGGGGGGEVIPPGPVDELPILLAYTPSQDHFLEVVMVGVTSVYVRTLDRNGQVRESSQAPLPVDPIKRIEVNYWFSTGGEATDGGVFLTIDGKLATEILGLDNFEYKELTLDWAFGPPNDTIGWSGKLGLSDMELWNSVNPPVYRPLRSESGDVPDLSSWDEVIGITSLAIEGLLTNSDPEYRLNFPGDGSPVALVANIPDVTSHLDIAVTIGLDNVNAGSGNKWTFLKLEETGQSGTAPVSLQIRRNLFGNAFEVRLLLSEQPRYTSSWTPLPTGQSRIKLLLNWWKADPVAGTTGGARLYADGTLALEVTGRDNGGTTFDRVRFEIENQSVTVTGSMVVDDFYAWR